MFKVDCKDTSSWFLCIKIDFEQVSEETMDYDLNW